MGIHTVKTQQLFAVEAIADVNSLFLTSGSATDFTSIATLLNREKTKQAVFMKTGRQLIESVAFGDINLCLTLGTAKFAFSLTRQRVSLQTLTTEGVKTRYGLRFGKSIQANRTFDMFSKTFQQTPSLSQIESRNYETHQSIVSSIPPRITRLTASMTSRSSLF